MAYTSLSVGQTPQGSTLHVQKSLWLYLICVKFLLPQGRGGLLGALLPCVIMEQCFPINPIFAHLTMYQLLRKVVIYNPRKPFRPKERGRNAFSQTLCICMCHFSPAQM